MRVFMLTDLEGVAGVASSEDQTGRDSRYYEAARKLLTAEVNAAVEGLIEGGADEVVVWDGHGCGAVVFEDLHSSARLIHGRPMAPWAAIAEVIRTCQAGVLVGQHAMAGTARGNLDHTQNSRAIEHYKLNGRAIGELAQFALYCGGLGVPTVFLSGDEAACCEAQELIPGIVTVAVKQGLGRHCALALSAAEARKRIRQGALEALQKHRKKPIAPLVWPGPYVLEKRFFHTDAADSQGQRAGAERVDPLTIRFRSDNILSLIYY